MLRNNLLSFRIWKQNLNIFFRSIVNSFFVNHTFYPIFRKVEFLWWRHQFLDDVIFFIYEVPFMIEIICTNFHDHSTSESKNIERGRFYPPWGSRSKKSLGLIGLRSDTATMGWFYSTLSKFCLIHNPVGTERSSNVHITSMTSILHYIWLNPVSTERSSNVHITSMTSI